MSRSAARARASYDRTNLYAEITDKIISELEAQSAAPTAAEGGRRTDLRQSLRRNVSTTLRQPVFEFKLGFPAFGLAG
jgi:antirestriction protein ArdC